MRLLHFISYISAASASSLYDLLYWQKLQMDTCQVYTIIEYPCAIQTFRPSNTVIWNDACTTTINVTNAPTNVDTTVTSTTTIGISPSTTTSTLTISLIISTTVTITSSTLTLIMPSSTLALDWAGLLDTSIIYTLFEATTSSILPESSLFHTASPSGPISSQTPSTSSIPPPASELVFSSTPYTTSYAISTSELLSINTAISLETTSFSSSKLASSNARSSSTNKFMPPCGPLRKGKRPPSC